jgi:hypothetical protein
VRLIFDDSKPTGEYEDFITGFVVFDEEYRADPLASRSPRMVR